MTDWVSTQEAARILCVSRSTLGGIELPSVRRKLPDGAQGAQRAGWLWYRDDLVLVRELRERCHVGLFAASRFATYVQSLAEDSSNSEPASRVAYAGETGD